MTCHRSSQAVTAALPFSRVRHILSAKQPASHLTNSAHVDMPPLFSSSDCCAVFRKVVQSSCYVRKVSAYRICQPQSQENEASRISLAASKIDAASKKSNKNVLQLTC